MPITSKLSISPSVMGNPQYYEEENYNDGEDVEDGGDNGCRWWW